MVKFTIDKKMYAGAGIATVIFAILRVMGIIPYWQLVAIPFVTLYAMFYAVAIALTIIYKLNKGD